MQIQKSEYAPHGCISVGPPDRPEPPRDDPRADEIDFAAVLKMFGGSEAAFEGAAKYGRPGAIGRRFDPRNFWNLTPVFSRRAFERWRADLRAVVASLR